MKIKYRKSDNVIVSMGACDFAEDSEFGVASVNQDIPNEQISNFKYNGSVIEKRPDAEIEAEDAPKKNVRKSDKQFAREKMNLTKPEMKRFAAGLKAYIEDNGED